MSGCWKPPQCYVCLSVVRINNSTSIGLFPSKLMQKIRETFESPDPFFFESYKHGLTNLRVITSDLYNI